MRFLLRATVAVFAVVTAMAGRPCTAADLASLCVSIRPAYVFIAGGSGVVIRPDGLMLTNDHVLEDRRTFDVRLGDGRSFKARVLGRDEVGDLAVLKIDGPEGEPLPHLPLGDSDAVRVGDEVVAVGNPFALGVIDQTPTFTLGIISAIQHTQGAYTECIVTDAELNPGNSGGPLVTLAGEVVGINGQISTRYGLRSNTGLGFAISARQVALWLPLLENAKGGEVQHGRLVGIEFEGRDRESPASVVVEDVAEGSAAAAAGFLPGDTILAIDGEPVPNGHRLAALLGIYPEGHEAAIRIRRDGSEETLRAILTAPKRCRSGIDLERPRSGDFSPVVKTIEKGSSAETAGIRAGDVIVSFGGRRLEFSSREERKAFDRVLRTGIHAGDIVPLVVRRGDDAGGTTEVELRLVAR